MPRCPCSDIHPPARPEYRRINSEYQEPAPGVRDIGLPGVAIDSGRGRQIRAPSGRKINAAQASHPSRIARGRRANSAGSVIRRTVVRESRPAGIAVAGGSVPFCEEDSLRRPQRPGVRNAPEHVLGTSRQFTLENRRVPPALLQSPSRLCRHLTCALFSTVLECENDRNKKSVLCCEEAVEDRDSLWKAKEKTRKILRHRSARHTKKPGFRAALIFGNPCSEA
jgi:hypothetical protein